VLLQPITATTYAATVVTAAAFPNHVAPVQLLHPMTSTNSTFWARPSSLQRGFLYLAFGIKYLNEAAASAVKLRYWHAEPICLITDCLPSGFDVSAFDCVMQMEMRLDYRDKILIRNSPFLRTIFLDSDTHVTGSLDELFSILDRFDLGVQFTEGGHHYSLPGVPPIFYEPSAGIVAFNSSSKVSSFFDVWDAVYEEIESSQGQPGAWDQRSLRKALYLSNLQIFSIPTEYQFYTYKPNLVAGQVRMIHGRGLSNSQIHQICVSSSFRLWIPKVGWTPVPSHAKPYQLLIFGLQLVCRSVMLCIRNFLALTKVMPYPVNKRPA